MISRIKRFIRIYLPPTRLVVVSFALIILLGAILLSLPVAMQPGHSISFVDALFTSVSATCVTGLAVADTGTTFSLFGQLVILVCIQIGGLGLMTFTTVFLVMAGRRLAIADRIAIQESFHHTPNGKVKNLIKYIAIATFITEAAGAMALAVYWLITKRFATVVETFYQAIFHSVSAFCNAGFALFSDSMMGFQRDPVVLFIITSLIIAGGLGFLVGLDIKEYFQEWAFHNLWSEQVKKRIGAIRPRPRLSVHTKLVVIATAALIIIGTLSFYFLERSGGVLAGMSEGDAWMNAYFCAVTPRTAGFNSVDYASLSGASWLCTMVFMFIGASPGSCGGGIKTSTFALLAVYAFMRWRGYARVHLFNRTVPQGSIDRGAGVVIAAMALVVVASSVLMVTETYGIPPGESHRETLSILFETISAFGTVGLSLGQTTVLTGAGKIIIALVMFMGRVGPLTLALAMSRRRGRAQYRYAEENVMVG